MQPTHAQNMTIDHFQCAVLTLTLTLIFKDDILCLLYYVHDIGLHASINLTNALQFSIYDKLERSIDFFMAAIFE